jgi:hypothetical protein
LIANLALHGRIQSELNCRVKTASKWQRSPSRDNDFKAKAGFAFVSIE